MTASLTTPLRPLKDHALRETLANEVHARPAESLRAPLRASHFAMLSGEGAGESDRAHLARLCERAGVAPPPPGATHHSADLGTCRIKWERHTEFSSYTVFRPGGSGDSFTDTALGAVPPEWLAGVAGEMLAGVHLALLPSDSPLASPEGLQGVFGSDGFVGARMAGGGSTGWTDFRIHADGFGRYVLADHGMKPRQAGRLVQRLIEIDTYRMMALMALPLARGVLPRIRSIEAELATLTERTTRIARMEDEQALLQQLSKLAAEAEQTAAETTYRFAAARAYSDLVSRRISELREDRIEGMQTIAEFMARRLTPAVSTCEAVAKRQESLSARIGRASNLLRTRVDLAVEEQNRDLLRSMDRRASLQLRLQETVEGLSVVAISYYLIGIVSYLAKALKGIGLPINPDLAVGLAVPVVLMLVWQGVRRIRKVVTGEEHG
ncbi:membrane protein [Skermanella stibiiresistens SB22]|uniref:Membrane protein n=1 Tax=Skermanella stibiiresistens SB22 TaxID=1385369 RepID=W9GYR0_9PROT|nr:DUF3422 domain-containing protein [Skermanella stibiiresistens]EWY37582.1 membrane protein [Skermanella stibiiresistens SB22]